MAALKVFLWCAPRSVSTAFERSIMTLKNTKTIHEPFGHPFYFGPERQSQRYASTPDDPNQTYQKVKHSICEGNDGLDLVFCKDMAYYMDGKYDIFIEEEFKDFKHTFLVRDPAKTVPSLYRLSVDPQLSDWDCFDSNEAGFRQLYELCQFVAQHLDPNPVVVDADDLLDHPNETMKTYCEAVGIKYEPHMTTWEPGRAPDWNFWSTGWYGSVLKTSGFTPRVNKTENANEEDNLPEEVLKVIEECTPYYKYLAARRISLTACGNNVII